jgi:hypothetical protein
LCRPAFRSMLVVILADGERRGTGLFRLAREGLGEKTVTTNDRGKVSFTFTPSAALSVGEFVTATATDASGNTSEFSAAREVQ